MRSVASLLIGLVFVVNELVAQQHPFIQFSTRDGLAQSQVRCIEQDKNGFIWFGTVGGASRFDGIEFKSYSILEGLPDPQVLDILCMKDSSIWLGTGNGLVRFIANKFIPVPIPAAGEEHRINLLTEDIDGELIVSVDRVGVYKRSQNGFILLPGYDLNAEVPVRSILPTGAGSYLIGTRDGLFELKDDLMAEIDLRTEYTPSISSMDMSPTGSVWISTYGDGIFELTEDGAITNYDEIDGLLQNNIRHIEIDKNGRAWASSKFGLNLIENGEIRSFTIYRGMPNDNVSITYEDEEGSIWIGTDGAGVLKYSGDRFVTYTTVDGLCSDLVMSIVPDQRGDLWLGTYGNGVCRMDGMAMINTLDGLPNNTIWSGLHTGGGRFMFGTSDGLTTMKFGVVESLDTDGLLDRTRVFCIVPDSSGNIWCGTRNGVTVIPPDGQAHELDIPARSIRSIVHTNAGPSYLCGADGVFVVAGSKVDHITSKTGLSDDNAFCGVLDSDGRIWVGTANGLNCITDTGITTLLLGPDYGSNYINLLNHSSDGRLSIGTNNGLYIGKTSDLLNGEKPDHYTEADGLRAREFNLNATYTDTLGRSWFGTTGGLLLHDPSKNSPGERVHVPRIHIVGIRSFLKDKDWSEESTSIDTRTGLPVNLKVLPNKNYLTFDYVGINHTVPEKVEYRYRLSGHDEDWLPPTQARFASYSNLSHGDYTFEVIARVPGSSWSEPASIGFTVLRPFWLTWWFILLCALALIGGVWLAMRWRRAQRKTAEKTKQLVLRSRMLQLEQQALNANMNRHFVFNALNSIQFYINKQEKNTANKYLTSFAKLIRKNLDNSQSDTTTLAEELERLELYLELEHMRFADKFDYNVEVAQQLDLISVPIPAMMLQPYVENSIWHGILPSERHGHVSISVLPADNKRVKVIIEDNGIGVDESLARKQNEDHISKGIEITKGRADVLRRLNISDIDITGPVQIKDETGQVAGTLVTIELPVTTVPRSNG